MTDKNTNDHDNNNLDTGDECDATGEGIGEKHFTEDLPTNNEPSSERSGSSESDDEFDPFKERPFAEALRANKVSFPERSGPPPFTIEFELIEEQLEQACRMLLSKSCCCVVFGDAFVAEFTNSVLHYLLAQRHEDELKTVCRIIDCNSYLLNKSVDDFLTILDDNLQQEELLVIHLPLHSKGICEPLFTHEYWHRLLQVVTGSERNSAVIIAIDQEQQELPDYIHRLLAPEHTCKVPWLMILVDQWRRYAGLDNDECQRITNHLEQAVTVGGKAFRWAQSLSLLRPQPEILDNNDRSRWFIDNINTTIRYSERVLIDRLTHLMRERWQRPLIRTMLGFYCLLRVDSRVPYQVLQVLGRRFLLRETIRIPVEVEEVIEMDVLDDNKMRSVKRTDQYQPQEAALVWDKLFESLLLECGLETDMDESGLHVQENHDLWRGAQLAVYIYRRFPQTVHNIRQNVIDEQYLFPWGDDDDSLALSRSYAQILLAIHHYDPCYLPLEPLVNQLLALGVESVEVRSQALLASVQKEQPDRKVINRSQENTLWDYGAYGIALLFLAIVDTNIISDDKQSLFEKVTQEALRNYKCARLLVSAFEMLIQQDDFASHHYLFLILSHAWRNNAEGRGELWQAVRAGFVQRMRHSIEYRQQILYELAENQPEQSEQSHAHATMIARLWHDAARSDFLRSDVLVKDTFAGIIRDGAPEEIERLILEFTAFEPSNIAAGNLSYDYMCSTLAKVLLHDIHDDNVAAFSLVADILNKQLLTYINQTHNKNIAQAAQSALANPEVDGLWQRISRTRDPLLRFYLMLRIQEAETGRVWIRQQLHIYTQYRNIVLAEWAAVAAGYPVGNANPEGQDIIERYLTLLAQTVDGTLLKDLCRDWQTAVKWLYSLESDLEAPSGAAQDIRESYHFVKRHLQDKSRRLQAMSHWLTDYTKQQTTQELVP